MSCHRLSAFCALNRLFPGHPHPTLPGMWIASPPGMKLTALRKLIRRRPTECLLALVIMVVCMMVAWSQYRVQAPSGGLNASSSPSPGQFFPIGVPETAAVLQIEFLEPRQQH